MLVREQQLSEIDSNAIKEKMKENSNIKLQQLLVNSDLSSPSQTKGEKKAFSYTAIHNVQNLASQYLKS